MDNPTNSHEISEPDRREQLKAMGVATLGGMLEYFEFVIFVYLAAQISNHFFSPDMPQWVKLMQAFGIFAAGFLIRPVGGILMAQLGDRVGRKKIFSLALIFMAAPTLIIGLLPGYEQVGILAPILLLACRLMQGVSLGGELPGAICFVSEQVRGRAMPLALGILAASLGLGAFLGSVIVTVLSNTLGAEAMMEFGWRIPFILGGIFGFVSVYLRRFTRETPVFEAMKKHCQLSDEPPLKVLLKKHRMNLVLGMFIAGTVTVLATTTQQYPMTFFTVNRSLPIEAISPIQAIMIFCTMSGNILAGWAVSRGAPLLPTFLTCQMIAMTSLFWLFAQEASNGLLMPAIILSLATGGAMALPLILFVRAFPAQQRYTGIATCYNLPIAIVGGTALLVLTYLSHLDPSYTAVYPAALILISSAATLALWRRRHPVNPFAQKLEDSRETVAKGSSKARPIPATDNI